MGKTIVHDLPDKGSGNTKWFWGLTEFQQSETRRQVGFKNKEWPGIKYGRHTKFKDRLYPHILPSDEVSLEDVFYPNVGRDVIDYFRKEDIAVHTEALNLRSSQVACVNFLWPLKQDSGFGVAALKQFLPGIKNITGLEFEYTGPKGITEWLGEPPGGKRGQNRTSIDCAIFWENEVGKKIATLIEWKYTEAEFGVCSAYSNAEAGEKDNCRNILSIGSDKCLLDTDKPQRSRNYWSLLDEAGISLMSFDGLNICPFQGPFYQLMRQLLIASFIRNHDTEYDEAEVVVITFAGNDSLHKVPRNLQNLKRKEGDSVVDIWNRSLTEVPTMRIITVEEIIRNIDQMKHNHRNWHSYLSLRYGV